MIEALHFGGGKDSLACLHLLKDKWPSLYVVWMNTGAAFPETIEQMEKVKAHIPNFIEVNSSVLGDIEKNGYPSDLVPVRNTAVGRQATGEETKIRPWTECCWRNLWLPMAVKMKELGVERIYRGQRNVEGYKSPVVSGQVVDGIEYVFPIFDWSDAQLRDYIKANSIELPRNYGYMRTSLDCWCCTAYLDTKGDQIRYMEKFHPGKFAVVEMRLRKIEEAVDKPLNYLRML